MNDMVNTFLLVVDKSKPKLSLVKTRFMYSTCGPFKKNKERIQKFKERETV